MFDENILNLGGGVERSFTEAQVLRATDPVLSPQPYASPADFAAQYPQPLDTTEIIAMCEEITAWAALPDEDTSLKAETWRELNALAFTSGSSYISFADGDCPEEYTHNGTNTTVNLKNIGAKKTLSESDIKHSVAISAANWNGINRLVGGAPAGQGMPGGSNVPSFLQETVAGVKEKEVWLAMTLVMNGWDRLLVNGNSGSNSLEFDGIETTVTGANGAHVNTAAGGQSASGTYSAATFDRFLSESCAKPTHVFGHPTAIQEMLSSYFQLGFQGSQQVFFSDGNRITPGFNFAGFVNTGVGRMAVISDNNFDRDASSATGFSSSLFPLRMTHNGVPLVYKLNQFRLMMKDLVPGCTAVSFIVWAKTALVIKHKCAQGRFTAQFTGNIVTTCSQIG